MSKKYVIKNCPATYQNFEDKFVCTSHIKQKGFPFYCQDCTDCVMKYIVGVCVEYGDKWDDCDFSNGLSGEIFKLLDIQEVE